jgi:hypothetical protein
MTGRRAGYRRSIPVLVVAIAVPALWGANAQAAIVGLERVTPVSPLNSSDKGITATCPAGKKLVGPGIDVTPGDGHVLVDDVRPSADLQSLFVRAREDETGTPSAWYVAAYAICADPPPGLVRASATSASNSSNKTVTVNCPSPKKLLGLSGEINSPNGQVLLEDITPVAGLASGRVKAIEDQTGNPGNWSLTAYAICANPIAGLVRASRTSPSNTSNNKVVDTPCPVGKRVVSAAGDINTPNGQIVLDAVFSYPGNATAGFAAWEDDTGNTANWSLTGYAICANSAERVGVQAGPSQEGLPAEPDAPCPAGRQATGSGFEIAQLQGGSEVAVHWLIPDPSPPTRIKALGIQHGFINSGDDYRLTAYAICATPLPGLAVAANTSASDSAPGKSVTATCPAGKKVVGLGGNVTDGYRVEPGGPAGLFVVGEVLMNGLFPNAALTSVRVNAFEDEDGFTGNWSLTAYAICASPPPGLTLVSNSTVASSSFLKIVTANCPSGKNLLGTGGGLFGGQGQMVIDDLLPAKSLKSASVTAVEDQTGFFADWIASAYAICANP